MSKKHIILGLAICLIFIVILLLQAGGEGMKNSIGSSITDSLKKLLVKDNKITLKALSKALSASASQCKIKRSNGQHFLVVQKDNSCTARFSMKKDVDVRTLPKVKYKSGRCHIELYHYKNPHFEQPESHKLPDPEKNTLKMSIFENGARLTIQATGNSCSLVIL